MKTKLDQNLLKLTRLAILSGGLVFTACTKNSTTVNTGPQLPAEAIRGTTLNGGNVKGVMLADSTYTVNGDLTVLASDTLTIQAGATIKMNDKFHSFYVNGVIQGLGTQAKPIIIEPNSSSTVPGQWGGIHADSAKAVTFLWTKFLWAGGADSTSGGTTQTIGISAPINVDIEDCWFVGGQDNQIGVFSTATVKIVRNTFLNNGTSDGDIIDFHSGVHGIVAYNVLWNSAGNGIKVYTDKTLVTVPTDVDVYNNTSVESGSRRPTATEPGCGIIVDSYSRGRIYNNLLVNNTYSLNITTTSDYANTKYDYNWFYVTVDSLRQYMYPSASKGVPQPHDVIDLVNTGANNPMFVNYSKAADPFSRIVPTSLDFHLQSGSPALGKGTTSWAGSSGLAIAPSTDIGAYVSDTSNGKGNRHSAGY